MRLTVVNDDDAYEMEVQATDPAAQLMSLLEGLTGIPLTEQVLLHNGRPLNQGATLAASGVAAGDLLQVTRVAPAPAAPNGFGQVGMPAVPRMQPQAPANTPEEMMRALAQHPAQMAMLPSHIAEAVRMGNVARFTDYIEDLQRSRAAQQDQAKFEAEIANSDPMDPAVQERIAERIRQKNVEESFERAQEEHPEMFINVTMLYVRMEVNKTPVVAFVDSGAQRSIMSKDCAERCGILHLLDKRFAGVARGVGSGNILGRIHLAVLKVGNNFLNLGIDVLENNDINFLFGLDMLRRFRCSIDLLKNALSFPDQNLALPFLQEHEIPSRDLLFGGEALKDSDSAEAGSGHTLGGDPLSAAAPSPAQAAAQAAQARAAANAPIVPVPTAAPVPQPAPTPSPANAAPAAAANMSDKISRLMLLGFSQAECTQALQAMGGNEEMAASLLFEGSMMG